MGHAKDEMMKWEALGCRPVGDKNICPDCVGDYALKQFIIDNAAHQECDYCGSTFDKPTCAEADTLIEHIAKSIGYEYEDPVHSVSYCSAEGGYLLPTQDADDLLCNFDLDEFSQDAADALDGLWVEKDPYGDRPWEYMLSNWAGFADHVKHEQRFFFPRAPVAGKPDSSILEEAIQVTDELGMIKVLPPGTQLFRARQHAAGVAPSTAVELGTPPADKATFSNRMSPAGIPMFYAAKDTLTARKETETADPLKNEMTVGTFKTSAPLVVLDLADLPLFPSLFDDARRHLRTGFKFIREFADELALPITRNGQEHIEYVPTQMVSEYIRSVFQLPDGKRIDGLCYKSAKNSGGVCVCLFLNHADFVDSAVNGSKAPLLEATNTSTL